MGKKTFVLLLAITIVLMCFSGCGKHAIFGDKTDIFYYDYRETSEGVYWGRIWMHDGLDFDNLPLGTFVVIELEVRNNMVVDVKEYEVRKGYDRSKRKVTSIDTSKNKNPPEKLVEIVEKFYYETR